MSKTSENYQQTPNGPRDTQALNVSNWATVSEPYLQDTRLYAEWDSVLDPDEVKDLTSLEPERQGENHVQYDMGNISINIYELSGSHNRITIESEDRDYATLEEIHNTLENKEELEEKPIKEGTFL